MTDLERILRFEIVHGLQSLVVEKNETKGEMKLIVSDISRGDTATIQLGREQLKELRDVLIELGPDDSIRALVLGN